MGGVTAEAAVTRHLTASAVVVGGLSASAIISKSGGAAQYYDGSYTFTPSAEAQTIEISGLLARDDITINPIPSNYGLVTWDGATLTVS